MTTHTVVLFKGFDPELQTVDVHHDFENAITLTEAGSLNDETFLPGCELSIGEWFQQAREI